MHQPSPSPGQRRRRVCSATGDGRRERPLGHLRAAVLRGDDQLHRSPGHRHPQADAAAGVRLVRDRLRRHRVRVPARLRDRPAARRAGSWTGSARGAGSSWRSSSGASPRWRTPRRPSSAGRRRRSSRRSASTYTVSVAGFIGARFLLGLGEAGNFPAAIKIVAEWFPKRERALRHRALQLRHEHRRADHAARSCPWITLTWGWYWAFIATGAIGFLWLFVLGAALPRPGEPPGVGARGARLHPQRSAGAGRARAVARGAAACGRPGRSCSASS